MDVSLVSLKVCSRGFGHGIYGHGTLAMLCGKAYTKSCVVLIVPRFVRQFG